MKWIHSLHGQCKPAVEFLILLPQRTQIKVLKRGFAEYGLPDEILTDHETQFVTAKRRGSINLRIFSLRMELAHRCEDSLSTNKLKDRKVLWLDGAEAPSV
jgi:hypothetical protein